LNLGSGGTTITQIHEKPFVKEQIYQDALTSGASIMVFQFGTNDIRKFTIGNKKYDWNEKEFKIDYIDVIERFQSLLQNPVIFICIPPPVYCTNCGAGIQPNLSNHVLPNVIREIAYRTGAILIDVFKALGGTELDKPEAFYPKDKLERIQWGNQSPFDGFHPNSIGNKYMAKFIGHAIRDHIYKEKEEEMVYHHQHVINNNASQISALSDRTIASRTKIKPDNVYDYIVNHLKNNETPTFRPVLACVGVSIYIYGYMYIYICIYMYVCTYIDNNDSFMFINAIIITEMLCEKCVCIYECMYECMYYICICI
jgi:lysophospholipase L1-like esterase